jgi:hypothetical protein
MKYILTESQLSVILEQEDLCLSDFSETVNSSLNGIVQLSDDEIYSAYEEPMELANEIKDPKAKASFNNVMENLSNMSYAEVLAELKKLISLKNTLKEQQTPYLEQTVNVAGVQMSKPLVHGILGLLIISVLSKLINYLATSMDNVKPARRRPGRNVIGCQGARGRAQAVRRRRRRENWRSFLRKMGLR